MSRYLHPSACGPPVGEAVPCSAAGSPAVASKSSTGSRALPPQRMGTTRAASNGRLRSCTPRAEPFDRPRLMGILNVTPDSFSDGGAHADRERAVAHGLRLAPRKVRTSST